MPRFDHRAVPIVLVAVAIDAIGFGIVMPVLPALITRLGHADLQHATRIGGWLLAAFAVAQFFAGPVLGQFGDRFGRRPVLIASMAAFALDYALMAFAPTLAWLFVGRVVAGIAGATYGPAGAVIADVSPPERRAAAFGLLGAGFGIGFIVGPALGGIAAGFGTHAPFIVAAVLAALNALAMILFLPETLDAAHRRPFRWREAHVVGSFRPLFAAGNALPLLVAWFLWQLGSMVYPATWSFWTTIRFGWTPGQIGWSLAWVGLVTVVAQVGLTDRVVRRFGEFGAAAIALAASAACLVACAFATAGWQVYVFFLVGALGAFAYPALSGLASRMVDAGRQGALQGGLASINAVAEIIGPILAAQALAFGTGRGFPGAAFLVAGALVATAGILILGAAHRLPASKDTAS
ncbi:MFS transporter [Sphingomonas sp. KR1UV-12]|uniref:MFS transporter n=1 Tax=Sphingomonas aurea TaxID=3063994 RepID=A0ABT9EHW1_9SPHN|nr:MFS transporter [Sphingomonas sp. KR1UV-12]MDP1026556.1 MFS transporter [Sphingomonas sp. KR1UV-12]